METSTFCQLGETIWDYQGLWNTSSPRFSRCFLTTIPPLVPSLFLWALTPLEVYFNWYRRLKDLSLPVRPIAYNLYNVSRLVAVLVVVGVALVQFTYQLLTLFYCDGVGGVDDHRIYRSAQLSLSDFWYSLSTACTFLLLFAILQGQRRVGMHTSGLVFLFTFLSIAFSMPQLYMYLRFYGEEGLLVANHFVGSNNSRSHLKNHHPFHLQDLEEQLVWRTPQLIFFSLHLSMVIVIFLLSCFSDQRPGGPGPPHPFLSGSSLVGGNRIADLITASAALKGETGCREGGFNLSRNHYQPQKEQDLKAAKQSKGRGSINVVASSGGFNGLETTFYSAQHRKNSSLKMMNSSTVTLAPPPASLSTSKRLSIAPEAPQQESPELRASFLSQLTFWWFTPLAIHGYRKSLTMDDLWRLNREDTTAYIAPRADRQWIRQVRLQSGDKSTKKLPSSVFNVDDEFEFPSIESLKLSRAEIATLLASPSRPSVVRCLYATFRLAIWQGVFFKFLQDLVQFISPFLLKVFIDFVITPAEAQWHGFAIAVAFFLVANTETLILNYYFYRMYLLGARMQTALISAIYRKSLQLSNAALRETTTGEIVNLMSVDAQRFVDQMPYINLIWSAPLRILLLIYFIWRELGASVLAGVAVMALMVPINWYFTAYQRRLQMKQMVKKDERVKVIGEMLTGMRVIKLYGWEVPFIRKVSCIRDKEIVQLREIAYINTITSFIWTLAPFLVSFVTFAVYVLSSPEHILDAKKAFVSVSLFNLMQFPLSMLPRTIASVVALSISVKRLNRFFNSPQLQNYVTRSDEVNGEGDDSAILIKKGTFAWEKREAEREIGEKKGELPTKALADENSTGSDSLPEETSTVVVETDLGGSNPEFTATPQKATTTNKNCSPTTTIRPVALSEISLSIRRGSLVAIVGHVGAGKSSLLSAILGDMELLSGSVTVCPASSKIAYVAQQAWIRNASLRENILFGAPYVKERYEAVLEMCALKPDIAMLPGGDETEIGEKGINLSGGQKQRVAVARACYSQASIVLLDDPLSAVDSHVARHIFARVISSEAGYLAGRTRVLVTNNLAILPSVDLIVVLSSGQVTELGTYEELLATGGHFAAFVAEFSEGVTAVAAKNTEKEDSNIASENSIEPPQFRPKTTSVDYGVLAARNSATSGSRRPTRGPSADDQRKKLIRSEHTETGEVKAIVYLHYFRSLTYFWLAMVLAGYVGIQLSSVGSSVWLAIWSNDATNSEHEHLPADQTVIISGSASLNANGNSTTIEEVSTLGNVTQADIYQRNSRLAVFGLFGLAQGVFVLFAAIAKEKAIVRSSITLHRSLLESIMRSPMTFFDTTPLGRIVNRFSKDIDAVDYKIPHTIHSWLMTFLQVALTLLLIIVQVPVFLVVIIPIIIMYHFIQKFYVATSRQLKRLESVTRSPIYSHFGETLSGVSTIRAFGATRCFIGESNYRMDTNSRSYYPSFIDNRWLAVRLEFCGNLVVFFTAVFSVLSRAAFAAAPGFIGLIVTYALQITQTLNWLVRMTSEMETNVVSVERIGEYCENLREREWTRAENGSPEVALSWPQEGRISFSGYSVRYREGLDLVLKDVHLEVGASEKVGIVGRTGSGKSTLTLGLFRILEPAAGNITIDGIDISEIGLHELRSKLAIIPQDPVLFSGTIRSNLDPFAVYSDEQLWTALEQAHLRPYIASLPAGLMAPVAENGANLSVGQRSLICLSRALLRRTRILVLDEATAAIDLETDALIQATIRREFAHATVLTIAHRINTILDADRILVLDRGRVVEFQAPQVLLADPGSAFYSLAKDAGLV